MGTNDPNTNDKQGDASTWLVITNSAGKFICKTGLSQEEILEEMDDGGSIQVNEVIDYACPMQTIPAPDGRGAQLIKANFASRVDSTMEPVTAHISLNGALVYFFDDLSSADLRHYKQLLQEAIAGAKASAEARTRRESSVVIATELPGGPLGRRP